MKASTPFQATLSPSLALTIILLALLAGFSTPSTPAGALHATPLVVTLAATQPDRLISVIIQKSSAGVALDGEVARLGGTVTKDLHIINAIAAEMPAAAAAELAKSDGVRWVSLDGPVVNAGGPDGTPGKGQLLSVYNQAIGADKLWAQGYQGSGITVAVLDSGWTDNEDFRATMAGGDMRLLTRVGFNSNETNLDDHYGHGEHVMGIVGGNGRNSAGGYLGVAPKVNIISVKVNDKGGQASTSGVVSGLQWVLDHRLLYNIRVVNLSMNETVKESYHTNALDAALEILWTNRIVVVVSGGNNGTTAAGAIYPPANDPLVITVGAVNDKGTLSVSDDLLATYSAYGTTTDGFLKPDVVAPGSNIVAPLASGGVELAKAHPDHLVNNTAYFRMSGTSMAAAVTSGAVALLLQVQPNLNPDQVKYRLMNTSSRTVNNGGRAVAYLDVYSAATSTTMNSANKGTVLNSLLHADLLPTLLGSLIWNSLSWNSVSWNSVSWNSVSWNSVSWNSDYWGW